MSETKSPGFRIVALHQEGFKRIKLVDITPGPYLVQITGKNEQGKSSLMDGIAATLDGGAQFLQTVPIQVGRDKAVMQVTIGSGEVGAEKIEMIVTKTIRRREDGTEAPTLVVENAEGFRAPSPQKMLDAYLGVMTFDPGKFMRMSAEDQFDTISAMVPGVDFNDIAMKNASDYAKRTEINRDAKRARTAAEAIIVPDSIDATTTAADEVALTDELAGAGEHNAKLEARKLRRAQVKEQIDAGPALLADMEKTGNDAIKDLQEKADEAVKEVRDEIRRLEARITTITEIAADNQTKIAAATVIKYREVKTNLDAMQAALDKAEPLPEPIDTEALRARITEARNANIAIRERERRADLIAEAEELETESEALTEAMDARDKTKEEAIAAAKLPVPGLSLGQNAKGKGVVLLDGLPLAQASHARKLRTSAEIAMSMNTKLRVMLIQEAAFLDADNMEVLSQLAIENKYQIFVERVDSSGKVGFVIEDGHIAGVDVPEPAKEEPKPKVARSSGRNKAEKLGNLL